MRPSLLLHLRTILVLHKAVVRTSVRSTGGTESQIAAVVVVVDDVVAAAVVVGGTVVVVVVADGGSAAAVERERSRY